MMSREGIVHLLDDEPAMLRALSRLLREAGLEVRAHSSARRFLQVYSREEVSCLVLDVDMPEMNGLELQRHLALEGAWLPIVFLTGRGDIRMTVRAIKAGAVDFLTKPVDDADLLRAVENALRRARSEAKRLSNSAALRQRAEMLTPREREVMSLVVVGKLNKQIAADLGTSEQNIKIHRGRVMQKMGAESVAELVVAAQLLTSAAETSSKNIADA